MFNRHLATITVSTELFQIEPLQEYVCRLARMAGVADDRSMQLKILIEEVFSHIIEKNFLGHKDGTVTISVDVTPASLILRFLYQGMPFAYDFEKPDGEADEISLTLIRALTTSYWIKENGKQGQAIELNIAVETDLKEEEAEDPSPSTVADEDIVLRQICPEDAERMVQCLYKVFGYSYSAEEVYSPDLMRHRLASGLYRGFVAVIPDGDIVAHVAMLKGKVTDTICESGQAFVSPAYDHRRLFARLKNNLFLEARRLGMRGVFSHAMTGHPYTQKANLKLGCVETGLLLSYAPMEHKSNIDCVDEGRRQTVMAFFLPTEHCKPMTLYVPGKHSGIIRSTYRRLGIRRDFAAPSDAVPLPSGYSDIEEEVKSDWNQMHLHIRKACNDIEGRLLLSLRRAMAHNIAVVYSSLDLTDPMTPHIAEIMEHCGFVYSGIMPYGMDDCDMLEMQYVADTGIDGDCIITVSDWAKEMKDYILNLLHNVE